MLTLRSCLILSIVISIGDSFRKIPLTSYQPMYLQLYNGPVCHSSYIVNENFAMISINGKYLLKLSEVGELVLLNLTTAINHEILWRSYGNGDRLHFNRRSGTLTMFDKHTTVWHHIGQRHGETNPLSVFCVNLSEDGHFVVYPLYASENGTLISSRMELEFISEPDFYNSIFFPSAICQSKEIIRINETLISDDGRLRVQLNSLGQLIIGNRILPTPAASRAAAIWFDKIRGKLIILDKNDERIWETRGSHTVASGPYCVSIIEIDTIVIFQISNSQPVWIM